jgi:hypothetical protein
LFQKKSRLIVNYHLRPKDFEKKVNLYASKFNKVYQIWDSNKIDKPSYKFNNEIKTIRKNYGTKFSKDFDTECKIIQQQITRLTKYEEIVKTVPDNKEYNWYKSIMPNLSATPINIYT